MKIITTDSQTEYFYLLNPVTLILVSVKVMPSRHDLIHLVAKCTRVCCEIGFAASVSVSIDWHVYNHAWENFSNDIKSLLADIFQKDLRETHEEHLTST